MQRMIDVSDLDVRKLIIAAYELSSPQGMGYMHYREGAIPDAILEEILNRKQWSSQRSDGRISMDYVLGRAVKMTIFLSGDEAKPNMKINAPWFDHSDDDLFMLLVKSGMRIEQAQNRIAAALQGAA